MVGENALKGFEPQSTISMFFSAGFAANKVDLCLRRTGQMQSIIARRSGHQAALPHTRDAAAELFQR